MANQQVTVQVKDGIVGQSLAPQQDRNWKCIQRSTVTECSRTGALSSYYDYSVPENRSMEEMEKHDSLVTGRRSHIFPSALLNTCIDRSQPGSVHFAVGRFFFIRPQRYLFFDGWSNQRAQEGFYSQVKGMGGAMDL
eukprot:3250744-Amphidinium_carterae.1